MTTDDLPPELQSRPQSHREWSGWLRNIILPLAIVAAIVGGLLYYQSRGSRSSSNTGFGTVAMPAAKNSTGKPPAAEVGRLAPDFLLQKLGGGNLRLSDLQGHPVIVNFWASWCVPCRDETPQLVQLYDQHRARGLIVVGVDLEEADQQARSFASEFGMDYPIVMDRGGQVATTWRVGGSVQGIPATYFIDKNGVIAKIVYGGLQAKDIQDGLALISGGEG